MPDVHHSATTMFKRSYSSLFLTGILCLLVLSACKNSRKKPGDTIAHSPQELQQKTEDLIHGLIDYAVDNEGQVDDSIVLRQPKLVQMLYEKNEFVPAWSVKEQWQPLGDSLFSFITAAQLNGLFPDDYHIKTLQVIRDRFFNDSTRKSDRKDAALWSKAELMLTDAFVNIVKDIKLGRLPQDSVTLRKDSVLADEFYLQQFKSLRESGSLATIIRSLEPKHKGYQLLKSAIPEFLDSADYRDFTKVPSPEKIETNDFRKALQKRLFEGGYIAFDSVMADSAQLANAVKKFQQSKSITADGKAGEGTVRMLNLSDREKFIRIAISMDRYKMLPEKMPEKYIWVNLPSYYMHLQSGDSVKLVSKIICGKAKTRTPLLTSAVSEIITYPQWTVPTSIIVKEILPAVKRNPGYLARKGFSLLNGKGEEVDPYSVDWSKYSKGIPYRVVQGSGDANALGVLKFNFPNKYAVYLHDTNQRYLFGVTTRSLSHGCVRVQEWEKLATYIIRNDRPEMNVKNAMLDSMASWLSKKEKHSIPVKNKLPVFIRYFTCEGKNGSIVFYEDIYNEDKKLREKYFASK
jgi:murein L,D-transpeptidase YcbB/YkuD